MKLCQAPPFFPFAAESGKKTISFLLIAAILITYRQVFDFGFLTYDTGVYVTDNLKVQAGLTLENIRWALLTNFFSNWHPLTWISHMLDVEIWGMNPGGHHATNLFIHICNSLLVFSFFAKFTGKTWESGFVAALFALHPQHIESVAWIAERKDVLSTFFFLIALHAYIRYIEAQNITHYLLVLVAFMLALMSKPMVVTFPFVLLLLDYWPLGRCTASTLPQSQQSKLSNNPVLAVVLEKIPFFFLAAIGAWMTLLAQQASMVSTSDLSLAMRLANACTAYLAYIGKTLWPVSLAVLYPHPGMPATLSIVASFCILAAITFCGIMWWRTRPWLIIGWLWFLGTLVPVIGIVHVGYQAMADRYMYIPHIGLFLVLVWGATASFQRFHVPNKVAAALAFLILLACSVTTQFQLRYWQDDATLFKRAIEVTGDNYIAETNLGVHLLYEGKLDEAEMHLKRAVQINPQFYIAYMNLGRVYSLQGKSEEAINNYRKSLNINNSAIETFFATNFSLASELEKIGLVDEAIFHYQKAIESKPNSIPSYINLGKLLVQIDKHKEALFIFNKLLSFDKNNLSAKEEIKKIYEK